MFDDSWDPKLAIVKRRILTPLAILAGGIFFLSQAVALAKFGVVHFALVPGWLSDLYWYFIPVGAVIFALLLWVNSEGHHYPWEHAEDDEEYAHYYDEHDE